MISVKAMDEGADGQRSPLLTELPPSSNGSIEPLKRTGNVWTATAHIVTGVIGSGVLSLAWSTAQMGWIAGPVAILAFSAVTVTSSLLLCDCYRSPDPEFGLTINRSYMDAVRSNLGSQGILQTMGESPDETHATALAGSKSVWICGLFQNLQLYGVGIAYTITCAISARAIQRSNCYHKEGHDAPCSHGDSIYMLLFGLVQIFCSMIPDFHNMEWLSILAAIMSFSYASIGVGLALAKVIGNGMIKGSIGGITTTTAAQKLWKVSQAVGDIAFAFPYSMILLEIQDTLKSPPPENQTMKKASMTAIFITTFFYLCCGCFGYAAFGNVTPGNLLTGFGFYEPYWLVDLANACIVVHLVGGYQVYSQPVFAFVERWCSAKFPNSQFVNNFYTLKVPMFPTFQMNLFRLCFRTAYVATTTGLAMVFPYFNQVLGVLGSLSFWPLGIYFPVKMYFVQRKIQPWTKTWVFLQGFSVACLLVSMMASVGSIEGIISARLK